MRPTCARLTFARPTFRLRHPRTGRFITLAALLALSLARS